MVDKTIIEQLKNNSEPAFKQLVETYKTKVVNTCFGFLNNSADADDVAQEVFIEVYQSIESFKGEAKLSTWIYRIAVNKSLDYLRKTKRQKRWASLLRMEPNNIETIDNWAVDTKTPETNLEQDERIGILKKAIDKLPTQQKKAFTLHKYEDISYQEIAEIMETTLSSVESLMHRAKLNLKNNLRIYYENRL